MEKKYFKRLLTRCLKGNVDPNEQALVQRWYDSFGDSKEGVPRLEDEGQVERTGKALDERIRRAVWPDRRVGKERTHLAYWQKIAAAIILTAAVGAVWWYAIHSMGGSSANRLAVRSIPALYDIQTGVRQVKRLVLPDSSVIYLNANSRMRIPKSFEPDKREVFLDEGEAYFEVAKDAQRPFSVQADVLRIRVLGTSFNVKAYSGMDDLSVTVNTGKVQVADTTKVLGELTASQGLSYHRFDGEYTSFVAHALKHQSWIEGMVHLEKARFGELAIAMYNLYGISLHCEDPYMFNYRYNIIIRSDRSLEETMEMICAIHKNKYRRKGNEITMYP